MNSDIQRYWFDITTLSRWQGSAVGIVRVERELAARVNILLPADVAYCIYDLNVSAFRRVPESVANSIISGKVIIDHSLQRRSRKRSPKKRRLRNYLRHPLRGFPFLYYVSLRVRGKHRELSYEDIKSIILSRSASLQNHNSNTLVVEMQDFPILTLSRHDTIISAGLDWEHKEIGRIMLDKQRYQFNYIAVLYDLIPLLYPHYISQNYADVLRNYFGELLWTADKLMCISECTRDDLIRHCADYAITPPPSAVFPLGSNLLNSSHSPDDDNDVLNDLSGKKFALFVSTIEPRKNHRVLYDAWVHALESGKLDSAIHRLVFVGRMGWLVGDLMQEISTNPLTRDTIVILQSVSDEVLAKLYERCTVTLFPSHYEGYGLPVAEALALGKPCIAARGGSLGEIGGELVKRIDSRDVFGWADAIATSFKDCAAMKDWGDRIRAQYRPVTWDDAAVSFFAGIQRAS